MRKASIFILLFFSFFFIKINGVYAYKSGDTTYEELIKTTYCSTINTGKTGARGLYTYDINSVTVSNGNLVIEGWGVLNSLNGKNKINNIEPKFMLTLEGYSADPTDLDKLGTYVGSINYENKDELPSYSKKDATPNDYTEYYFNSTSCSDPYRLYRKTDERSSYADGDALCCNSSCQKAGDQNYLYINLNFKFEIPLSKIKSFANSGANRVYMRLSIATSKGSVTVYGNSIETEDSNQSCIPIAIQSSRIGDAVAKQLKTYGIANIKSPTKQITIMVKDSRPRATKSYFGKWWYKKTTANLGTILESASATDAPGKGYSFVFFPQKEFTVISTSKIYPVKIGNYINQIITYVYPVGIGLYYDKYLEFYDDYVIDTNSATGNVAYVPAMWAKPYLSGYGTFFEITPSCEANLECAIDKLDLKDRSKITCPIENKNDLANTECCKTICAIDANKETYYCKNMCKITYSCAADPRCDNLGINTTCPAGGKNKNNKAGDEATTNCCTEICTPSNSGTPYCTNICNTPVKKDCDTITDPQEKYCCLYGTADAESSQFCAIYDDADSSYTKANVCTKATTEATFKYPTAGWGDEGLTSNEACNISCEEIIKTTFQPNQSVRAGMGYAYPINVNGTRYCTAEYKNAIWSSDLRTAASIANTAYGVMKTALEAAKPLDDACGVMVLSTPIGNNCTGDYSTRIGDQCQKTTTTAPTCPSYDSDTLKVECDLSGTSCNCKTTVYTAADDCPKEDPYCKSSTTTSTSYACSGHAGDNGSSCYDYSYKSACDFPYYLNSSGGCIKQICSVSGQYFPDAQTPIISLLTNASNAKRTYDANVARFNSLMNQRTACNINNFATSNPYKGMTNPSVSYDEIGGSTQITDPDGNTQEKYSVTDTKLGASAFVGTKKTASYNIMVSNNKYLTIPTPSIPAANSGTIDSYTKITYFDYTPDTAMYDDFWNERSSAINMLEFSINYYVQRYTGELSATPRSGYDMGVDSNGNPNGRRVYTDFYQMSTIQKFELALEKLGPNLPYSHDGSISLNPYTCSYTVNNMIFPPKGDPKNDGDLNNEEYGSVAFRFRQISLTEPFPNRVAGENWLGHEYRIDPDIYNNPPSGFHLGGEYYLDATRMQAIRAYNDSMHNYGSYDINNPYNSPFLNNWIGGWK